MDLPVTFPTESDEVFFNIIAQLTSRGNVVNFQCCTRAARLAPPAVALQDWSMQQGIVLWMKPDSRALTNVRGEASAPLCTR